MVGIYIGVIDEVKECYTSYYGYAHVTNFAKIFMYDVDSAQRSAETIEARDLDASTTLRNTSWGPIWAEVGDIVVIAAGSATLLVLRKYEDAYLFIGCYWLVDSEAMWA